MGVPFWQRNKGRKVGREKWGVLEQCNTTSTLRRADQRGPYLHDICNYLITPYNKLPAFGRWVTLQEYASCFTPSTFVGPHVQTLFKEWPQVRERGYLGVREKMFLCTWLNGGKLFLLQLKKNKKTISALLFRYIKSISEFPTFSEFRNDVGMTPSL